MTRSTFAIAAIAGYAAAQQGYGYGSGPSTTYACNPAHQYPTGEVCTEISGYLTLVTVAPTGYSTASTPAPSSSTGPPSAETCSCYAKLGECQTAPDANQSFCASEFASCLNYNPYTDDSTAYFNNLKKYCTPVTSSNAPPQYTPTTSMTAPPQYTTAPSAPSTKACECYAKLGQCQTAPDANQSFCASQFAECAGENPYTGDATAYFDNLKKICNAAPTYTNAPPQYTPAPSTPSAPSAKTCECYAKLGQCQTAPDANQSLCASDFSACAGGNPYSGDVAAYFDNLKKTCSAAPTSASAPPPYTPAPSATSAPSAKTCECYAKLGQCQTAPDANQSFCSSQFAECAGENPYTGDATAYFDNLKKICSAAPSSTNAPPQYTPAPSTPAGPGAPSAETCSCYAKLGECQVAPDANQSFCASQFATCATDNPYTLDSAAQTAYFNNLKNNCGKPAASSTMATYPAQSATKTGVMPVSYTGAAAPVKAAGPIVAAMAFGALFL